MKAMWHSAIPGIELVDSKASIFNIRTAFFTRHSSHCCSSQTTHSSHGCFSRVILLMNFQWQKTPSGNPDFHLHSNHNCLENTSRFCVCSWTYLKSLRGMDGRVSKCIFRGLVTGRTVRFTLSPWILRTRAYSSERTVRFTLSPFENTRLLKRPQCAHSLHSRSSTTFQIKLNL